jgi:hypothetical protein
LAILTTIVDLDEDREGDAEPSLRKPRNISVTSANSQMEVVEAGSWAAVPAATRPASPFCDAGADHDPGFAALA